MKTLERYVFGSFLTAFFLSWLILSFVLTIGLLVKIVELMIEGMPAKAVGTFVLVSFPWTLFLTIPVGLLVSALLVFSRLSVDSEIAAMRACGVNLLQIIRWPLLFGAACTVFCVWVNNEIVPRSHEMRQNLKSFISVDVGLDLLEPGRINDDFEKVKIYFEKREGNWIYDLRIFDNSNPKGTRIISASKALVATNGTDLVLDLYKVSLDPVEIGRPGVATVDRDHRVIPNALKVKQVKRKLKDLQFQELREKIADIRANPENLPKKAMRTRLSQARTEFHVRLVYAVAAFCFVLIGVPLGIKTQRKESSVGIGVSLAVALVYYLFVILALSLDKRPALQPYLLVWIPVALCGLLASYLIPKNL
ncbi:MAG: LptF/LptG family permease [Kiritimatiellae bacterium]|nr:LptF/LptG family permease [Kiritimatiellia bacterium]